MSTQKFIQSVSNLDEFEMQFEELFNVSYYFIRKRTVFIDKTELAIVEDAIFCMGPPTSVWMVIIACIYIQLCLSFHTLFKRNMVFHKVIFCSEMKLAHVYSMNIYIYLNVRN